MTPVRVGLCFDHQSLFSPRYARALAALDILVFPELLDGGYAALKRGALPHRASDPFLADFVTASMTVRCCIVAGSTRFSDRPRQQMNTCFVFQEGRLIHRYDKIHLFRPAGDDRFFVRGRSIRPFIVCAAGHRLRGGIVICYDLRFPELTRSLAQQGIRMLFVPARWPAKRDDAWRTLLKARAIENQIFVIGCNALGPEGGTSYAFDPLGRLIFTNPRNSSSRLVQFTLDLDAVQEAHAFHSNISDAVLLGERPPLRLLKGRTWKRERASLSRTKSG